MNDIRVRFAPSPTGFLHIGGARTALFNWLFARGCGGAFVLRIEDTDEVRSTGESVAAILDSMRWLGLDFDEGPAEFDPSTGRWGSRGPHGPYFQMERLGGYRNAVERLLSDGKAYRCFCSKEDIDAARKLALAEKRQGRILCPCRDIPTDRAEALESGGRTASVRLRMPDSGDTVVQDGIRGPVAFENRLLQDLVIRKGSGGPTYNFACVIDDHAMRISHVIRGDEHLSNTPYQMRLHEALGLEPPAYAHLSMILGPDGAKLSKRHGATSVLEYRDKGYLPETLRNYLALLGWSTHDSQQIFRTEELVEKFGLPGCQKNPAVFDPVKLDWMNGVRLREMTPEALVDAAGPFLRPAGLSDAPRDRLLAAVGLEREKFKLLSDVPARVDFFFKDVAYDPKAVDKVLRKEGVRDILQGLRGMLADLGGFEEKALEESVRAFCAGRGLKPSAVFHPLRVAVSGRAEGPTLFLMLQMLGKETVLSRLRRAADLT
jgi:glutamyl-tRNA synthetase